jgi:hypothetical protein
MTEQEKAILPHQLLIVSIMLFDILTPIISLLSEMEKVFLPVGSVCSLSVILFIYIKSKTINETRLINANWKKVWKRAFFLLIAYAVSSTIMLISSLFSLMQPDEQLRSIMRIAASRIAIVPTLLVVTPLLIMSTKSITQMRRGEFKA